MAAGERVAVAYSGGLDSSLIAKLASGGAGAVCYSCAAEGSSDAKHVTEHGLADRLEVRVISVNASEMPSIVSKTARAIDSADPVTIAYSIPTLVVLERSEEKGVLAGNGADELFGGYAKYSGNAHFESMMEQDLVKSMGEAERLMAFADSMGKRIRFPFLTERVVATAKDIPVSQKITGSTRKSMLREVGRLAGLADPERPKKAAQYSSGTLKMMRSLAKTEHLSLEEWVSRVTQEKKFGKD